MRIIFPFSFYPRLPKTSRESCNVFAPGPSMPSHPQVEISGGNGEGVLQVQMTCMGMKSWKKAFQENMTLGRERPMDGG